MTFMEICLEVLAITEELECGNISFTYDKLASAMKMGHPAEFLMECLDDVLVDVRDNIAPKREQVDRLVKGLKRIKRNFKIKELSKPIKDLTIYLGELENS